MACDRHSSVVSSHYLVGRLTFSFGSKLQTSEYCSSGWGSNGLCDAKLGGKKGREGWPGETKMFSHQIRLPKTKVT